MKRLIKKTVQKSSQAFFKTRIGRIFNDVAVEDVMNRVKTVEYKGVQMRFSVPTALNEFRVKTFATKEPETLEWLDKLPDSCTLWDIGANIGLYSVYAAKRKKCRVIAFEPSVFNLELLARNIFLNDLQDEIVIMPLPLSDDLGQNLLKMTTTEWGGGTFHFR